MFHRHIGPWKVVPADIEIIKAAAVADGLLENRGEHEEIADDRHFTVHRHDPGASRPSPSRSVASPCASRLVGFECKVEDLGQMRHPARVALPSKGSTQRDTQACMLGKAFCCTAAIMAAPAAPASSRETAPHCCVERARKHRPKALRAGGAARYAHFLRDVAHRCVTIARRKTQSLENPPHQVVESRRYVDAGEHRARRGFKEWPALAGLRDIGMIENAAAGMARIRSSRSLSRSARLRSMPSCLSIPRARSSSQSILSVEAMFDCICAYMPGTGKAMV